MKFNNPLQLQGPAPAALVELGQAAFVASQNWQQQIVTNQTFSAFLFVVNITAGGTLWAARAAASPVGNAPWSFKGAFSYEQNLAGQVIVGSANNAGDQVTFNVYLGAISSGNFTVYGLPTYKPTNIRPDGYNYPVGALGQNSAAAGTLVAAPGPGFRILLADIMAAANGNTVAVEATVAGVTMVLADLLAAGTIWTRRESGLLLDNNTAITIVVAAAPVFAVDVTYDIVPSI